MNRLFATVALGIFITWAAYAFAMKHIESLNNTGWPGTFGDSFGALNTLFTGLAFAGLIASLSLQRTELALQRKELKQQREVLEAQSRELSAQAEAMKRSAEAQERTAKAQEQAAKAQVRSATIAAKAEQLKALDATLASIGTSSSGHKSKIFIDTKEARLRLIAEIIQMADAVD
ncbi:hypothetical protein [Myxococcus sp. CA039A]|uniref:hypothetical protein n=1 Tax=Myxococcus sp. CA039A TaxID=2741737 RepID=UPI00157AAD1B|nr:hypothetical protein [Myxococcus sp. CA039A]NTX51130.1 hypothetical protein [Myxococcus sp. CA039A]